ncbi:hypothetical protein GCM10023339_76460 [Alloalcanivorax gelatiniphagus]
MLDASSSFRESQARLDARALGIAVIEADLSEPDAVIAAASLVSELRPGSPVEDCRTFLMQARLEGYAALVCRTTPGDWVALAGFRLLTTSRGRILMLEDLVVKGTHRRQGLGSVLIAHLRERAQETNCIRIELDTGVANRTAHRFYAGEGFAAVATHLASGIGQAAD